MELVANRSVVEHELRRALASRRANQKNSVLLLRAAPEWRAEPEFSFEDKDRRIAVTVAPCATVLALGLYPEIKPVDRWDLVKDAFGAVTLDQALTKKKDSNWIAEALLDAQ